MFYKKIKSKESVIEFHTNWLGYETVIINGKIVSKKYSFLGVNHYFTIFENGHFKPYVLTSKWDFSGPSGKYYIDLRCEGELVHENIHIQFSTKAKKEQNEFKIQGIKLLNEYLIEEAIKILNKSLVFDKNDPEIYFHLACCYSINENAKMAFKNIKISVENNLNDIEIILNHEMLAFMRIQEEFEEFLNSNFANYNENKLE